MPDCIRNRSIDDTASRDRNTDGGHRCSHGSLRSSNDSNTGMVAPIKRHRALWPAVGVVRVVLA